LRSSEFGKLHILAEESVLLEDARTPTEKEALAELFALLEDYAPSWYTEEHHTRALSALRDSGKQAYVARVQVRSVHP
jgi:hypothetical protein